ncbi:OadG family protein [Prolixibacteraceae bacterium Z1-6]|uniref:OadG family protein n=1 Tax=Draconibacterium aestuarii TaxID=2998507 RepID=A0A9X3F266_9BACT|nr:OadG family protein [Prolixibacteraceae bacterium Z1-6]
MTEALKLMLTGMSTVFFILIMVVVLGNLIIRLTNKFAPVPVASTVGAGKSTQEISPSKLAAIISAVEITTKGQGKVTSIEKLKNK